MSLARRMTDRLRVVPPSDQDPSLNPSIRVFWGVSPTVRRPQGIVSEYTENIIYLICPGNTQGSPTRSWKTLPGRGMSAIACLTCSHHYLAADTSLHGASSCWKWPLVDGKLWPVGDSHGQQQYSDGPWHSNHHTIGMKGPKLCQEHIPRIVSTPPLTRLHISSLQLFSVHCSISFRSCLTGKESDVFLSCWTRCVFGDASQLTPVVKRWWAELQFFCQLKQLLPFSSDLSHQQGAHWMFFFFTFCLSHHTKRLWRLLRVKIWEDQQFQGYLNQPGWHLQSCHGHLVMSDVNCNWSSWTHTCLVLCIGLLAHDWTITWVGSEQPWATVKQWLWGGSRARGLTRSF